MRTVGGIFSWVLSHTLGVVLGCLGQSFSNAIYKQAMVYRQRETVAAISTTPADNKRRMVGTWPESPSPKKKVHVPADARTAANAVPAAENESQGPSAQPEISQEQPEESMPDDSDNAVIQDKRAENEPEEMIPIMKRSNMSQRSAAETLPTPPDSRPSSSYSTSSRRSAFSQRSAYDDEAIRRNREANEDAEHAEEEARELEQKQKALKRQLERERVFKLKQKEAAKKKAAEEKARKQAEQEKLEAERKAQEKATQEELADDYLNFGAVITPLDKEWHKTVNDAMSAKNPLKVLARGTNGVEITRRDFGHILPQEGTADDPAGWLNDEIVNAFMESITVASNQKRGMKKGDGQVPYYASYQTGWWKTYNEKGVKGLERWSRRKGIQGENLLKCKFIFFPINTGSHWTLVVIDPFLKRIKYLDSLNRRDAARFFLFARRWLKMELGDKYVAEDWTDDDDRSSQQDNSNDCGVFVCFNALATVKYHPYWTVKASDMPQARRLLAAILINGGLHGRYELGV